MRTLPVILLCLIFLTACASTNPRVGLLVEGACTRDINAWGHAGRCSCDVGQTYDERAGLCLVGEDIETIMVDGPVSAGMMAIGGETTGFTIETGKGDIYELILKTADQEKMTKLSGMWFEIEGELITIESVERKERKAIIVERISVLE